MSCNGCSKVLDDGIFRSGLKYMLVQDSSRFLASDGKTYKLSDRLIPLSFHPQGGWSVELFIHNQPTVLTGKSHSEVFREAAAFLTMNEIAFTPNNLWLNLQIQWVSRSKTKHQKVTVQDLLNLASTNY